MLVKHVPVCANTRKYTSEFSLLDPLAGRWLVVDSSQITPKIAHRIAKRAADLRDWSCGRRVWLHRRPTIVNLGGYASVDVIGESASFQVGEAKRHLEVALRGRGFWLGRSYMLPFPENGMSPPWCLADEIRHLNELFEAEPTENSHITVVNKNDLEGKLELPGSVNLFAAYTGTLQWEALDEKIFY